jgi:uncharacterized protein YodC (DUF2158 family)
MTDHHFRLGDIVCLKSGSPDLTVLATKSAITVGWFDGTTDRETTYPPEALEFVSERNERDKRRFEAQRQENEQAARHLARHYFG